MVIKTMFFVMSLERFLEGGYVNVLNQRPDTPHETGYVKF